LNTPKIIKSTLLTAGIALLGAFPTQAADPDPSKWDETVNQAKDQHVYWNAWGGGARINDYIAWVGQQVKAQYGITLTHVKLDDTAKAVATVVAEKSAGQDKEGKVDLIWINGENFISMKEQGLLFGNSWTTKLPNYQYVDFENNSTIETDFTLPTDGMESPWGGAKMVFFYDSANDIKMPDSFLELVEWTKTNPGRFTYPQPPNFIGSSFLKQALTEVVEDRSKLLKPVIESEFDAVVAPLFTALDKMHPNLWRQGKAYPKNHEAMGQLMADNELDIIFAFNPSYASSKIANDELPDTVRSFTFSKGTLGNTHFVAIPYNSKAKAAALVVANFLISPDAQARKQDPNIWGDPTVLAMDKLSDAERAKFDALELGVATLKPSELGPKLPEPHPTWMSRLEVEWAKRYGVAN
jgi:putative thiamine transport system substrate-binding protein